MSAFLDDLGFTYTTHDAGATVRIAFHGRVVTTLRGHAATDFLDEAASASEAELQQTLARLTGQFKHGNERLARRHPRNR